MSHSALERMGTLKIGLPNGDEVTSPGPAAGRGSTDPRAHGAAAGLSGEADLPTRLDLGRLQVELEAIHRAGVPGVFAEVRAGHQAWLGAAGVADVDSGHPVDTGMRQRVGSLTKTFTAAAVLLQVERGHLQLDAPISRYLPDAVPGVRGDTITVRMLLNHTSNSPSIFRMPSRRCGASESLLGLSPDSFDDNQFRQFRAEELIAMGVAAPPTGEPGDTPGHYSNTNYLILGKLLEHTTGTTAQQYITQSLIEPIGLQHTRFPDSPHIDGPHSRMYEALFGLIDPTAGLQRLQHVLGIYRGKLDIDRRRSEQVLPRAAYRRDRQPVVAYTDAGNGARHRAGRHKIEYGLGLYKIEIAGHGTFWGHTGTAWGAETVSLTSADGTRQMSIAMNLARWKRLNSSGIPQPHPIDSALATFQQHALCGTQCACGDETP